MNQESLRLLWKVRMESMILTDIAKPLLAQAATSEKALSMSQVPGLRHEMSDCQECTVASIKMSCCEDIINQERCSHARHTERLTCITETECTQVFAVSEDFGAVGLASRFPC
jgi:hypothetical protein